MKQGMHVLILSTALFLLASCQTAKGPARPPEQGLPMPKVALVLGGGAARGFAHIGVIRALEREQIPMDMIVGTSIGSLIGAIYASSIDSSLLEFTALKLEKDDVMDYGFMTSMAGMGAAKGEKLEEFVQSKVSTMNIENLKIPFAAVATDLNRGTRVVLDRGSVARAVRASSSVPGVFYPVDHQGKLLVDGGVVDNLPVAVARERGADIVIAVDVSENVSNFNINSVLDVMFQAIMIMNAENSKFKKKEADILIAPDLGDVGMQDFSQKKKCVRAGTEAAQKMMPEIRAKIEAWGRKKLGLQ